MRSVLLLKAHQDARCRQAQNQGETGAARLLSFVRRVSSAHGRRAWESMPAVCLIRRGAGEAGVGTTWHLLLVFVTSLPAARSGHPGSASQGSSPEPGRAARMPLASPNPSPWPFPWLLRAPSLAPEARLSLFSPAFCVVSSPHVCTRPHVLPEGQSPPPTSSHRGSSEASLLSRPTRGAAWPLLQGPLSRAWAWRRAPLG